METVNKIIKAVSQGNTLNLNMGTVVQTFFSAEVSTKKVSFEELISVNKELKQFTFYFHLPPKKADGQNEHVTTFSENDCADFDVFGLIAMPSLKLVSTYF